MRISDVVEILLLAAVWGSSFLFLRIAAPIIEPIWLIEIRVLLSGLVLLPIVIWLKLWGEVRSSLVPLFIAGCLNSAIPFVLIAFASIELPAGFNSILNATSPLFGAVVAAVWLKERFTLSRTIGFICGFAGVLILIGWQPFAASFSIMAAIAASLLASLVYAIGAPYVKQKLSNVSPLVITTMSQLGAAVLLVPALPFTVPETVPSPKVVLAVLALALFSTPLSFVLYFRLIRNIGSTKALTVTYLVPLFTLLWGKLALSEPVTPSMLVGGGLILLGTAIANDLFRGLQAKA
ncbi:DMT family transporter [Pseudanabaenaceae cyanobacterium LEGE 13415]|nr:DMT family transporter [Pseudanabaenaceae cyanobacterium LEGE 13415]